MCLAFSARWFLVSSRALLVILALPSRPDRSSTTVAPLGNACGLPAVSVYVIVAPALTVLPEAGCAVAVTVSGELGVAAEVAVTATRAATVTTTAPRAGMTRVGPTCRGR